MQVPRKITHFNLFLDGRGYAGKVNSVTLPKLSVKTEAHRSGGMDAPLPVEMGMDEELELSFVIADYDGDVVTTFGFRAGGPVSAQFRGAKKLNGIVTPYVINATGTVTEIDHGEVKGGDNSELKCVMKLMYLRIDDAGRNLVTIDVLNNVRMIGGNDQLAAVKAAILFS